MMLTVDKLCTHLFINDNCCIDDFGGLLKGGEPTI